MTILLACWWSLVQGLERFLEASPSCYEHPGLKYSLDWSAIGESFFDDLDFLTLEENHGSAEYVGKETALKLGLARAYRTHAILSTGKASSTQKYRRLSTKVATRRNWTHFLAMMHYTHLPYGCGVWPAFWTNAVDVKWPEGGELDVFEYVNDAPVQTSFHTGRLNRCKLNAAEVNRCGPMPDTNKMDYDCLTEYPDRLGCAPNRQQLLLGMEWALRPGIIAVERTSSYLKVFFLPGNMTTLDGRHASPQPDNWDRWLMSYYPFNLSHRADPASCPNPAAVMQAQQLVLNIGFCGDWASKIWANGSCPKTVPNAPGCRAVDPLKETDPEEDCCTQFIWDGGNHHGTAEYLRSRAFFNITWMKVFAPAA